MAVNMTRVFILGLLLLQVVSVLSAPADMNDEKMTSSTDMSSTLMSTMNGTQMTNDTVSHWLMPFKTYTIKIGGACASSGKPMNPKDFCPTREDINACEVNGFEPICDSLNFTNHNPCAFCLFWHNSGQTLTVQSCSPCQNDPLIGILSDPNNENATLSPAISTTYLI